MLLGLVLLNPSSHIVKLVPKSANEIWSNGVHKVHQMSNKWNIVYG